MSTTYDYDTFHRLNQMAMDIFIPQLKHHPSVDVEVGQLNLLRVAETMRTYVIFSKEDIEALWSDIRSNVNTTDCLLELNSRLRLAVRLAGMDEAVLFSAIAQSYGLTAGRHTAIDETLLSQMSDDELIFQLLMDNPWLLTLLFLRNNISTLIAVLDVNKRREAFLQRS